MLCFMSFSPRMRRPHWVGVTSETGPAACGAGQNPYADLRCLLLERLEIAPDPPVCPTDVSGSDFCFHCRTAPKGSYSFPRLPLSFSLTTWDRLKSRDSIGRAISLFLGAVRTLCLYFKEQNLAATVPEILSKIELNYFFTLLSMFFII